MRREDVGTAARTAADEGFVVYERKRGWAALNLREVWNYRELLWFLTWRDVAIRYKQAVLGVAWAVIQPVLTMLVFTLIFNKALGVRLENSALPYVVFSMSGLVIWNYFSGGMSRAANCLVGGSHLITKVYFPRLVLPISGVTAGIADFLIAFVVLLVLMGVFGIAPVWTIVFVPVFVLLAAVTALAIGLWLSALNVLYRDFQYIVPFFLQLLMFVSTVIYPIEKVGGWLRVLVSVNPLTAAIDGFRWALLGEPYPSDYQWIGTGIIMVLLFGGLFFFKRIERVFADVV
jgi:lipopolysaccharide transport system permease protein